MKRSLCVRLIRSVVEVDVWSCVCEMWQEKYQRVMGFADVEKMEDRQGMRDVCTLGQQPGRTTGGFRLVFNTCLVLL